VSDTSGGTLNSLGSESQGASLASSVPSSGPPLTAAELIADLVKWRGREVLKLHAIPTADDLMFDQVMLGRINAERALLDYIEELEFMAHPAKGE
jgi:hypothetical protein